MPFDLVVMGASWGGMDAFRAVLGSLPRDFEAPIVIAQHRAVESDDELLERILGRSCELPLVGASDKEPLVGGHVYIAPADYHAIVERGHIELSTEAVVQFARPSIDVLFESAAGAYGAGTVGVLLTGMNEDGAAGLAAIADAGGFTVAQEPDTAARGEMPRAAIARGAAKRVLPLEEIGPFLATLRAGAAR